MPQLFLLLLAWAAEASRLNAGLHTASGAETSLFAGKLLRGRYRLQELLGSRQSEGAMANYSRSSEQEAPVVSRPLGTFPWGTGKDSPLNRDRYSSPEEVGRGQYGDTWKAYDLQAQVEVVIKIPYHSRREEYITKAMNSWSMREAEEECRMAQRLVAGESTYPEGRRHICKCLESHVSDQTSLDDVGFLVLEFCGVASITGIAKRQNSDPDPDFLKNLRHWIKGSLMAVAFLSGLDPPMRHGDLHGGNVVVTAGNEAKLIDFGRTGRGPAGEFPWLRDVERVGAMFGKALCGGVRPNGNKCLDGSKGAGQELDWDVVQMASAMNGKASPQMLIGLLP